MCAKLVSHLILDAEHRENERKKLMWWKVRLSLCSAGHPDALVVSQRGRQGLRALARGWFIYGRWEHSWGEAMCERADIIKRDNRIHKFQFMTSCATQCYLKMCINSINIWSSGAETSRFMVRPRTLVLTEKSHKLICIIIWNERRITLNTQKTKPSSERSGKDSPESRDWDTPRHEFI